MGKLLVRCEVKYNLSMIINQEHRYGSMVFLAHGYNKYCEVMPQSLAIIHPIKFGNEIPKRPSEFLIFLEESLRNVTTSPMSMIDHFFQGFIDHKI